jgi:CspA family cold shock protein
LGAAIDPSPNDAAADPPPTTVKGAEKVRKVRDGRQPVPPIPAAPTVCGLWPRHWACDATHHGAHFSWTRRLDPAVSRLASRSCYDIVALQPGDLAMAKGTVKWFNSQKGYGFIQPQGGGGKDVFVHISAVERAGLSTLNEGQVVEYEEVANKGKTSAENLKVQR